MQPDSSGDRYNRECQCVTLDREALKSELLRQPDGAALYRMIVEERPHLFSESPVFVTESYVHRQAEIIAAVERVIALPAYQARVLKYAPPTAHFVSKARGVFLGYDFHLGAEAPRLIEINTNAGGGMLNALLLRVQRRCGDLTSAPQGIRPAMFSSGQDVERVFLDMFLEEWRLERGGAPLRCIAIVDEQPENQFLFPEFLLFKNLFERNGIDALILDPGALEFRGGGVWHRDRRIDLVYNRMTDFGLTAKINENLRAAYLAGAVVVTPNPRVHALYADKRNLILLTDTAALREMGVDEDTVAVLFEGIAHTRGVRVEEAEALWAARKGLFFKPAAGYGSKAAYRGDKLTRRVFEEVIRGDYVAQTLVPPSERHLQVVNGPRPTAFKVDLRNYVYRGQIQLIVTRVYQGQTTNFRTPGGGFAPVLILSSVEDRPFQQR